VRPVETKNEALRLAGLGLNDCEIARRLDVPRFTVRDWRKVPYVAKRSAASRCPRCGDRSRRIALEAAQYAELLGLYLGDGHITQMARADRIRFFLDAKYPNIVDESEALLRSMLPDNRVGRVIAHEGRMVVLWAYSSHMTCLFPQHGAGKKHERRIALMPWQQELVATAPWAFLRGCIRSDGSVFVNRTGPYEYLSYDFCNLSQDILGIFEAVCLSLGLRPRRTSSRVRLNRRADVALLSDHVGVKS
jgi:hypothetical protein